MIYKFKFDGKDGIWDEEKREIIIGGVPVDTDNMNQFLLAKINKAIRQTLPKPDKLKLNIGCGHRPSLDAINLDYDPLCYPEIVRDVEEGLPFDDNKFDEIFSSHTIEHVKDIFFFMYEIWRVSKNKGKVTIICPNGCNLQTAIQPDHLRLINWGFFDRWRPEHHSVQTETRQTRNAYFNIIRRELINDEREILFELEAIK